MFRFQPLICPGFFEFFQMQEIDRMEREEAELLQRLRLSQERHRMAYMQLEDVIRGQGASLESAGLPGLPPFSLPPWDHQTATPSSSRRNAESPASRPTSQAGLERVEGVEGVERVALSKPPLPRAPPGARPRSGARSKPQVLPPTTPPDAVDQLRNLHSKSAMSNASTTSVGETSIVHSPGAYEGSGQSTSSSAPQIRYTTVDGVQLDIPAEEDLDLAAILNGRWVMSQCHQISALIEQGCWFARFHTLPTCTVWYQYCQVSENASNKCSDTRKTCCWRKQTRVGKTWSNEAPSSWLLEQKDWLSLDSWSRLLRYIHAKRGGFKYGFIRFHAGKWWLPGLRVDSLRIGPTKAFLQVAFPQMQTNKAGPQWSTTLQHMFKNWSTK